jgi:hypothetical protein
MLGLLNLILIIIIIIVIAVNMFLTFKNANQYKELKSKVDNFDITYLKEFKELDPFLKDLYTKYISGAIIPIVVKKFNALIANQEQYKTLKANPKEVETLMNAFIVQFKAGIESMSVEDLFGMASESGNTKETDRPARTIQEAENTLTTTRTILEAENTPTVTAITQEKYMDMYF